MVAPLHGDIIRAYQTNDSSIGYTCKERPAVLSMPSNFIGMTSRRVSGR